MSALGRRPGLDVQRAKIVDACFAALRARALEDLSVENLLEEARVSRQTFYRAFPGLSSVFAEVYRRIDRFLEDALARRLTAASSVEELIEAYVEATVDAALAAGPALLAVDREERRPGSPFRGATARRQARLARTAALWARARHGLAADELELIALLAACRELCLRAARRELAGERVKRACLGLAEGLLLRARRGKHA